MNIGGTHAISNKFEVQAMSVVVVQYPVYNCDTREDIQINLDHILGWMDSAAMGYPGYDLIVTQENGLQGFGDFSKTLIDYDGPEIQQLKDKCKLLKVWGAFNPWVKEYEGRKFVNLSIIINNKGEIVHNYVKMNPWIPGEDTVPGWMGVPVIDGPKGSKLATIICADGDYPEMWREAAFNGANVIIRMSHYMSPYDKAWKITNKAGAFNNQVYVVGCNSTGQDACYTYYGNSMIVNPDGTIITEAPVGNFEWCIKADLYPQIVDNNRRECCTFNLLWESRHRGASYTYADVPGIGEGLDDYKFMK